MDWRTVKKLAFLTEPPRAKPCQRSSILDKYKLIITSWLGDNPRMRATLIERQLRQSGYQGSYSTLKRLVREKKEEMFSRARLRFETLPGEQAQMDFSPLKIRYTNGEREVLWLYLFVLGFSRYKYAEITDSLKRKKIMYLVEQTFQEPGGVVKELLIDNLKPVAKRPRRFGSSGEVSEEWSRLESHYGFSTRLSLVYRAQTKGKVERGIDTIKGFLESKLYLK